MRAAALALALDTGAHTDDDGAFEGFQGSGDATPYTPVTLVRSDAGSSSADSSWARPEDTLQDAQDEDRRRRL
jgi:hypothetical protein